MSMLIRASSMPKVIRHHAHGQVVAAGDRLYWPDGDGRVWRWTDGTIIRGLKRSKVPLLILRAWIKAKVSGN